MNLCRQTFVAEQKGKLMDELSFTLSSPITEEEWDMISDVDFDNTNEITFHTKHGKEVKFVKAQPEYRLDEFCTDCREYDQDKHCCPRFNHVIRTTLDEIKQNAQPEIIRCQDCFWFRRNNIGEIWCDHPRGLVGFVEPSDYCSKGVRRTDGVDC